MKKWTGFVVLGIVLCAPVIKWLTNGAGAVVVQAQPAAVKGLRGSILASGTLRYEEEVQLSPELIGTVTRLLVHEGDHVERGQPLLFIDDRTLRAEVAQRTAAARVQRLEIAQQAANLANRQRQYRRVTRLLDLGYATRSAGDDADYSVESATIALNGSQASQAQADAVLSQVREQLAKTVVRAPISGTVIGINIKSGETAVPSSVGIAGSSLMTIANTESPVAELNVEEADIANVKPGQQVAIHATAYAGLAFTGTVLSAPLSPTRKDPAAALGGIGGSQARTYTVRVQIKPVSGVVLRSGMSCRAEIYTAAANRSVAVPIQSVIEEDSSQTDGPQKTASAHYVLVLSGERVERRRVEPGIADDSYQQILIGLKPGEMVIFAPYKELRNLRDGDTVMLGGGRTST